MLTRYGDVLILVRETTFWGDKLMSYTYSLEDAKLYAKHGIALLDEVRPGWREQIPAEELVMDSCSACILGHVYGNYETGLDMLAGDFNQSEFAVEYGFDIPGDASYVGSMSIGERYLLLQDAWTEALREGDSE